MSMAMLALLSAPSLTQRHLTAEETAGQQPPPGKADVVVALSGYFWWMHEFGKHWDVPGCTLKDRPLKCQYISTALAEGTASSTLLQNASALVHEGCWDPAALDARFHNLPQVMFSMEPITNWPCMNEQVADIEMSYRTCAQVWSPYWSWTDANFTVTAKHRDPALRAPPLQFSKKEHAIIYINTQCSAKSGRQDIIRHLQALLTASNSSLAVHSFGKCDPNMPPAELTKFHTDDVGSTRQQKKLAYFRRYKFCVTMENSITRDYVTEKVYDGLMAGCVPIYLGAPNIDDYIPDSNAIVNYAILGSPEALKAELERLAADQELYEQKLLWKTAGQHEWTAGFQALQKYSVRHPMCGLCSYIAEARLTGKV